MAETRATGGWFRRVRITLLATLLAVVLAYALKDGIRRRARTSWKRPLEIALVVAERGAVAPSSIAALRQRVGDLERRLAEERERYGSGQPPFRFQLYGPVPVASAPPTPASDGLVDLVVQAYRSWRYFGAIDSAADVPSSAFDSRIYLVVRTPADARRKAVEGQSEEGGRIGSVEVELDETMTDFALFVAAHELFHTLGASDKYDERGFARVPDGLGEPERKPLYPQAAAEVMARNVALGPGNERPPDTLDELRVGPATAREIRWLR